MCAKVCSEWASFISCIETMFVINLFSSALLWKNVKSRATFPRQWPSIMLKTSYPLQLWDRTVLYSCKNQLTQGTSCSVPITLSENCRQKYTQRQREPCGTAFNSLFNSSAFCADHRYMLSSKTSELYMRLGDKECQSQKPAIFPNITLGCPHKLQAQPSGTGCYNNQVMLS